jgi:hypothetical protein
VSDGPNPAEALARRYVWWQTPAETLRKPSKLLRQILALGTAEDYVLALGTWGEAAFRDALSSAPPGAIDDRSWAFWHRYYGLEIPPPPRRNFA